jgi:hypothetical protein
VSNFSVRQMEDLFRIPQGDRCVTNQMIYDIGERGIERDLLPWCARHGMPVMAYSPLGGSGASLLRDPAPARIAAAHGCSVAAVALAWTIRLCSACQRKCRCTCTDPDAPGAANSGCGASTASQIVREYEHCPLCKLIGQEPVADRLRAAMATFLAHLRQQPPRRPRKITIASATPGCGCARNAQNN